MVNYTQQTHNNSPTPYEENGGETTGGCSLGNRVYGRSIETSISSIGMTGIIKALFKSAKPV